MPIHSSSHPTGCCLRGYCSTSLQLPAGIICCNSVPPNTVKIRLNRERHSFTVEPAVFPNTPKRFALIKKSICVLTNCGLSGEREEEKDLIYFQSFYDAFQCSPRALVSMHTMTAIGDVTVAETQRNCSNYTCDNYYSNALSAEQKSVIQNYSQRM